MPEEPILSEKNQGVMLLPVNLRYAQFYISAKKQEAANWVNTLLNLDRFAILGISLCVTLSPLVI
jgi:hypothetical protein